MKSNTDDQLLSAFVDGELPEQEAAALRERLQHDEPLQRRLLAMREADATARGVFEELDRRPMPAAVLELLAAAAEKPAASANVVSLRGHKSAQFFQWPVALAASVALFAGFLGNELLRQSGQDMAGSGSLVAGVVAEGSALFDLLERGTSATVVAVADGVDAHLMLTFEDQQGDYCRQLRLASATQATFGVACLRGEGWTVEATALGTANAAGGAYIPASAATPAALEAVIDGLIGDREPLDADEEKLIISNGWNKSQN